MNSKERRKLQRLHLYKAKTIQTPEKEPLIITSMTPEKEINTNVVTPEKEITTSTTTPEKEHVKIMKKVSRIPEKEKLPNCITPEKEPPSLTSYHHTISNMRSLPKANRYHSPGVEDTNIEYRTDTDKPELQQQSIINKYKV